VTKPFAIVRGKTSFDKNGSAKHSSNDSMERVLRMAMPLVTLGLSKVTR